MQEHHGNPVTPAAFLDMQGMTAGYRQCMRQVGLDRWKQLLHGYTYRKKVASNKKGVQLHALQIMCNPGQELTRPRPVIR